MAGEPDGMLTLTVSAFLDSPNQKEREVLTYCSQHSNAAAAEVRKDSASAEFTLRAASRVTLGTLTARNKVLLYRG